MVPLITEDDLDRAGEKAGAYLDNINKTDLATLTADEWRNLLVIIVNETNAGACARWAAGMTVPVGGLG